MAVHTHNRITPIITLAANTVEEVNLTRDFKFISNGLITFHVRGVQA